MLSKTEIGQNVVLDYGGAKVLGKIIKAYGAKGGENLFAKINIATPHGSILYGGIAWFRLPSEDEMAQLKEYEVDAEQNNRLYQFDADKNIEY